MDVQEIIQKLETKFADEAFKNALKSDPVKAIENVIGTKIPEDKIKEVVAAVEKKIAAEGTENIVKEVEAKAEEALGGVKDLLGGILGGDKKD